MRAKSASRYDMTDFSRILWLPPVTYTKKLEERCSTATIRQASVDNQFGLSGAEQERLLLLPYLSCRKGGLQHSSLGVHRYAILSRPQFLATYSFHCVATMHAPESGLAKFSAREKSPVHFSKIQNKKKIFFYVHERALAERRLQEHQSFNRATHNFPS
jgi:hypothetical protein